MSEDVPPIGGQIARIGLVILALSGALFGIGIAAGVAGTHLGRGGGLDLKFIAVVAGALLFAAGCVYGGWRALRAASKAAGVPTSRERRNRIVLAGCGAAGGVIGVVLTMAGPTPLAAFSNAPLPPWLALALVVPILVLLPLVSLYWHRHVADEQEAAAYNKGALIGIYTYFIGAPAWWLLWRGGFVPEPNGVIIYLVTIYVTGAIWLWAKYR